MAIILYIPAIKNGYNLDDNFVAAKDVHAPFGKRLTEIFTTHYIENEGGFTYEYRPLVKLSFLMEEQIFGHKPGLSHFINLLLYAWALSLLHRFLMLYLGEAKRSSVNLTLLLFACMPIHSEVVLSLKNRDILLCFIFCFLAMNQILSDKKPIVKYSLATLFFTGAFLSKLDVVPFIFVAPFVVYTKYNIFSKPVIYSLLLVLFGWLMLLTLKAGLLQTMTTRHLEFYENPLTLQDSITNRFLVAIFSIGYYVTQAFVPISLMSYYGYGTFDYLHFGFYHATGIAVISGSAYLFYKYQKNTVIVFGLFTFYVFLSMYLNIVRLVSGVIADRFTFFLSIGLCLILAEVLTLNGLSFKALRFKYLQGNASLKWGFAGVILIFTIVSLKRTFDWKNKFTLYQADLAKAPDNYKLNTLLATEYAQEAKNNKQITMTQKRDMTLKSYELFKKAQGVYGGDYQTLNNIGYLELYVNLQPDTAIVYLKKSLQINNRFPETYENIAEAYRRTNQLDSSIRYRKLAWIRDTKNENRLLKLYAEYLKYGYTREATWLKAYCNKNKYSEQLKANVNSRVVN
ncbi:MAG: hypothetical protein JST26_20900 [Bacteroidetes bacterium]|nr:hypothetical protein [Bacteroidota bacterium]